MKGTLAELDCYQPHDSVLPLAYQGPLARHAEAGDRRLYHLAFHLSPAAHDLWNFLLTEETRLQAARAQGTFLVGAMKDLGTIPILVHALPQATAFYPDGAWWLPCFKEGQTRLMEVADAQGATEGFCPVRAMLGAFELKCHFPIPDALICSTGATCDDFRRWFSVWSNVVMLWSIGKFRTCVQWKQGKPRHAFLLGVACRRFWSM
jgi:hypothetical protein